MRSRDSGDSIFAERLSSTDDTLLFGYAMHIQRYELASRFIADKVVLDAGCGTGYGSHFLAANGARRVIGVDISESAVAEARDSFQRDNLSYLVANLEALDSVELPSAVDTIVNIENIEHLRHPEKLLERARALLAPDGVYLTSTPNGAISQRDESGRLLNRFHFNEWTRTEFRELLSPYFGGIELLGQWQTHDAKVRIREAESVFEQLCEAYFNPMMRIGRLLKRVLRRRVAPAPVFTAAGASYSCDHVIRPIDEPPYPWEPEVILAICRHR